MNTDDNSVAEYRVRCNLCGRVGTKYATEDMAQRVARRHIRLRHQFLAGVVVEVYGCTFFSLDFMPNRRDQELEQLHYECPLCEGSYIAEEHLFRHLDWHVDLGHVVACSPPGVSPDDN